MEKKEIVLTGGNIRNKHIYLTDVIDIFPKDVIGGGNKRSMGREVLVKTNTGLSFRTDIAGDKKIFRNRGQIGVFLRENRLKEGDAVVIKKISEYEYVLTTHG